jgi:hypothetical protein
MRRAGLALALVLAGCVDLAAPPELARRDAMLSVDNPDAYAPDPDSAAPVDTAAPDTEPELDAPPPAVDGETPDDPDAPISLPDVGQEMAVDAPLLANGTPCKTGSQCTSGQCVDDYCCDRACGGQCQACDVAGSLGRCVPIKAGDDPDNECSTEPVGTCGRDGSCDGAGACRKYAAGSTCMPGTCTGSTETEARTCTAAGACQGGGTTRMCTGGHTCVNGSCASMCGGDGECQNGFFCDAGHTCQLKRASGAACASTNQCASGFCVDGVCCNLACDQFCYACDLPGSVGTCNPVPDGQERGATPECPRQDPSTCGRVGGCNGRGICRVYDTGTTCGTQTCTGSTEAPPPRCDGLNACVAQSTHDCGAYLCNTNACGTTCTTAAQCKSGYTCVAMVCRQTKITKLVVHDTVAANVALWSLQSNLQIGTGGAHPWAEDMWKNTYLKSLDAAASPLFLGREWIKVATETKKYSGGPQATITLAAPATVYLIVDDRWGSSPGWLSGWSNSGLHVVVWETTTNPSFRFTAYRKVVSAAGTVDLPGIGASTAYNYFVIVD